MCVNVCCVHIYVCVCVYISNMQNMEFVTILAMFLHGGWYSTYLTTSTSGVSVIKKDARHEWLARLTSVYWWRPACLQGLPHAGKSRMPVCAMKNENRITKGKKTLSFVMLALYSWTPTPSQRLPAFAQMQWERKQHGTGTGAERQDEQGLGEGLWPDWINHRIPNISNNHQHYNKLEEEKVLSQRGPRSPVFCTERFLMAKGPQAQTQHEDTQSRPGCEDWTKPYLLMKGWGTPSAGG